MGRSNTIWEGEEFDGDGMSEEFPGLLPSNVFDVFDSCNLFGCDDSEESKPLELPKARYMLTNNTLKVITSEWADGYPADEDRFADDDFEQPGIMTTTDNIDLLAVEDVDNVTYSVERKVITSGCYGVCFGHKHKESTQPAQVVVTYRDKARGEDEQKQQVRLNVEASIVADVN